MLMNYEFLLGGLALLPASFGWPIEERKVTLNTRPDLYTLTAYVPNNQLYHGLKVNNLHLFQGKVSQYCPDVVDPCPNGTQMVFGSTLWPDSEVPGGQDLYVNNDGLIAITVQHSHSIPTDAYPAYEGWKWTPLAKPTDGKVHYAENCPRGDYLYNCKRPEGFWQFKAPDDTDGNGGIMACPDPFGTQSGHPNTLYAVTPNFNKKGCIKLVGLGTHFYDGNTRPNPPVWAY